MKLHMTSLFPFKFFFVSVLNLTRNKSTTRHRKTDMIQLISIWIIRIFQKEEFLESCKKSKRMKK